MPGLHSIIDDVIIVNRGFKLLIYAAKVVVVDLSDVVQVTANAAGSLCLICGTGSGCIQHISSNVLE